MSDRVDEEVELAGVGRLNVQRALDIARESEDPLYPPVAAFLRQSFDALWRSIQQSLDYIMSRWEFALFNYLVQTYRLSGNRIAQWAIANYWNRARAQAEPGSKRRR